jgi:hypothetical protein
VTFYRAGHLLARTDLDHLGRLDKLRLESLRTPRSGVGGRRAVVRALARFARPLHARGQFLTEALGEHVKGAAVRLARVRGGGTPAVLLRPYSGAVVNLTTCYHPCNTLAAHGTGRAGQRSRRDYLRGRGFRHCHWAMVAVRDTKNRRTGRHCALILERGVRLHGVQVTAMTRGPPGGTGRWLVF